MSDAPSGPDTPFDSFAGRLGKVLKKTARPPAEPAKDAAPPPGQPAPAEEPSPFDSFSGRLGKAMKETGSAPDQPADEAQPTEPSPEPRGPVGSGEHVVRQGECISSIAAGAGHFWETIWNDPANAELRDTRKDPNVLLPADRVHVPPLREKWEPRPTEMRHRFRRRGWPEVLRIRVLNDGEPRGNQPYTIDIDGKRFSGTTDANGKLSCPIVPNARRATLRIGVEPNVSEYTFALGAIDPIDEISGVQGRLNNLGFDCGPADGICGERTASALRDYQQSRRLPITGEPDDDTRRQLQSDYGC
jgi:hypothetical protein